MEVKYTTCPRDCPDSCGIVTTVEDGKIIKHSGQPDHPITRGVLCYKGTNYLKRFYSPNRILNPMLKTNGKWGKICWDEAFDIAAEKLNHYKETLGVQSILFVQYGGILAFVNQLAGKMFFNAFGGCTSVKGGLSHDGGAAGQKLDFGTVSSHVPKDMLNSKSMVIWGRNPVVTNLHMIQFIKEARKNGCKVYLVDPIKTETAKHVDNHFQLRAGSDGLLAIGITKILLESSRVDNSFIKELSVGFEEFKNILNKFTPEYIANETGITIKDIKKLADIYYDGKPTSTHLGIGPQYWRNGAAHFRLIDAMVGISGNLGIKGGGANYMPDRRSHIDTSMVTNVKPEKTRSILLPQIGKGILEAKEPPIKMAWVITANPVSTVPNSNLNAKAFESLDFVIVSDNFMTATAELADLFLPVTTYLENTDITTSYWHNLIGFVNPVVPPQGESKSDLEIFTTLAERMGLDKMVDLSARDWVEKLSQKLTKADPSFLSKSGTAKVSPLQDEIPFVDGKFLTDSGKFNFIQEYKYLERKKDANFPFNLIAPKTVKLINLQALEKDVPDYPDLALRKENGDELDITAGELVRVISSVGAIKARVSFTDDVLQENVKITPAIWKGNSKGINVLREDIVTDYGNCAAFHETMVRIEKINVE
ncbi:MAG: molybdopterin-dependent oxidoreductase [Candidatus Anammoxibacter sp.]